MEYEVTIKKAVGSCDSELFKKMVKRGDLQATKIVDAVGGKYIFTGYADCEVKTSDKKFNITYYATDDGFISSGSTIFKESVEAYIGDKLKLKVVSKTTENGTTYKAVPILGETNEE